MLIYANELFTNKIIKILVGISTAVNNLVGAIGVWAISPQYMDVALAYTLLHLMYKITWIINLKICQAERMVIYAS